MSSSEVKRVHLTCFVAQLSEYLLEKSRVVCHSRYQLIIVIIIIVVVDNSNNKQIKL